MITRVSKRAFLGTLSLEDVASAFDEAQVMIRGIDGRIHYWSEGAERLYGWSPRAAIGSVSHELLRTEFPQPLVEIDATLSRVGAWQGELQHQRQDGRPVFVASHWILRPRTDSEPVVIEINNDITESYLMRMEHQYLSAIVRSTDDAIISKDLSGVVTSWNRAAEKIFGYRADEIIGHPVAMLFTRATFGEEAGILDRIKRGQRIEHYETVRRRKDGVEIPVSVTISPIHNEAGQIVGAAKIAQDLSKQHNSERQLREAQAELFHVSRLSEIGQMASALAHELNQPLTAIANFTKASQILLENSESEDIQKARAAMQNVSDQALRAGQIIRRIREFVARGDTEKTEEQIGAIIEETLGMAGGSNGLAGIKITRQLNPALPKVVADKIQVQQVLLNLIRNAVEAMEGQDNPELTICASLKNGSIEISVSDNGRGLAPEVAARLFEPFISTKEKGMGVGLSICRTIVESHGGRLWASSNPSGGVTFSFTLARVTSDEEPTDD